MDQHYEPCIEDSMQRLERYIARRGLRMTRQRRVIAEVMSTIAGHVNIDQLYHQVRARDSNIGYATIYRTLKLLTDAGLATSAHFGDGAQRFESTVKGGHHDHLVCTNCGRIIEFHNEEIEKLQEEVCSSHSFQMIHHKMEIYGLCTNCA